MYETFSSTSLASLSSSLSALFILNIFSSETQSVKFHMETLWDERIKVCSNGSSHMTKLAAMPIYGKSL